MDTRKINFFVGTAQERTPAQGLKTLFVVGAPPAHEIVGNALEHRVAHVFIGANHPRNEAIERFDPNALDWPRVIDELLARNLRVTLEFLPEQYAWVRRSLRSLFDRPGFFAQMTVPLPEEVTDGVRLAIKVDNLAAPTAERGAWVWPLSMLRADHRFTPFASSPTDEIVGRRG